MAIEPTRIKAGETLFDVHRTKMGNTNMSRLGWWPVLVIDLRDGGALCSWNNNRPEFWPYHRLKGLRRKLPAKLDPEGRITARYCQPAPSEPGKGDGRG